MKTQNLTGTESQIRFAHEIMVKFYNSIALIKSKTSKYDKLIDDYTTEVEKITLASDIISGFKSSVEGKLSIPTNNIDWKYALNL